MITGGSASNVFFFFVGVGFGLLGVSGAVAAGVAAGVSFSCASPPPPSGAILGFGGAFFFDVPADGFVFTTCPSGPSFCCTVVGVSSGSVIAGSGTAWGGNGAGIGWYCMG